MIRAAPALLLSLATLPAAASDAVETGRQVFVRHCAGCHGPTATEGTAGDIRGLSVATITGAVQGFEMMPRIPLTDAEIAAVAAWLFAIAAD